MGIASELLLKLLQKIVMVRWHDNVCHIEHGNVGRRLAITVVDYKFVQRRLKIIAHQASLDLHLDYDNAFDAVHFYTMIPTLKTHGADFSGD